MLLLMMTMSCTCRPQGPARPGKRCPASWALVEAACSAHWRWNSEAEAEAETEGVEPKTEAVARWLCTHRHVSATYVTCAVDVKLEMELELEMEPPLEQTSTLSLNACSSSF
ncbi:hypothetical protein ACLKA7_011313 [Drosophila subpalustris]